MADATEVVAEAAEAVAEEATHVAEAARRMSPREVKIALVSLGLGVLAGTAVGHLITKRRAATQAEETIAEETEAMRVHYMAKSAVEDKPDLEEITAHYRSNEVDTQAVADAIVEDPAKLADLAEEVVSQHNAEVKNLFDDPRQAIYAAEAQASDPWNYAEELKNRTPEYPYVIHKDETGEMVEQEDYDDVTFTFYEGDGVLAGEKDEVIDNQDGIVGLSNLDRFGVGSGDSNVVHIRNDKLRMEIEVVRSKGSYAEEVHGFPTETTQAVRVYREAFDDDEPR